MKEIYKRFSEMKMDPGVDRVPVTEAEKDAVKGLRLKKRRTHHMLRNSFVAAAVLSLSVVTFGASFPALAAQLPIVGTVFALFQEGGQVVEDFGESSTAIGMTSEDQDVKVTVTDAVYDGESVAIYFTMESERDLGENPILDAFLTIDEYGDRNYMPGHYMIEKVSDHKYAGVEMVYLMTGSKPEGAIHVKWEGSELKVVEDLANPIEGDWTFAFDLEALEAKTVELADLTVTDQGMTVDVSKMTTTPVSNTIYLSNTVAAELREKWDDLETISMNFSVKDNLGHEYDVLQNGGYGDQSLGMSWRITAPAFDPEATSIFITPVASAYKQGKALSKDGMAREMELIEEITLQPIEVPLVGRTE